MYRILKESYKNFEKDFLISEAQENYRYKLMKAFKLLFDDEKWQMEKINQDDNYKKVADFLYYIKNNLNKYPDFQVIIWELEARGFYGKKFGVISKMDLEEIIKIFKMFLDLTYWH